MKNNSSNTEKKYDLQLEVRFRALSRNENAVLFLPPT